MPATASQLRQVRKFVGSKPDDATVNEVFDDPEDGQGDVKRTALSILETRLADFIAENPAYGLPGRFYRQGRNLGSLQLLERQIAALKGALGIAAPTVTWSKLTRAGRGR